MNTISNDNHIRYSYPLFISIIVTVRNEENTIRKCIDSLLFQSFSKEQFEIIIVDGNSIDSTQKIIRNIIKNNPQYNIKLVIQDKIGISNARNSGILCSSGEFIIFIDGDAYANFDLLESYSCCFNKNKNKNIGFYWGTVENANKKNLVSQALFFPYFSIISQKIGMGANMAYQHKIFDSVCMFEEEFTGRGDESFVNCRITNSGFLSVYCKNAIVHHEFPSSILQFLSIRYKEGISTRKLYNMCYNRDQKIRANIMIIFKLFSAVITLFILLLLSMYNFFFIGLFFILVTSFLILLYRKCGMTVTLNNFFYILLGIYIITIGHLCEVIGEYVAIFKEIGKKFRYLE